MKRNIITVIFILMTFQVSVRADEGMWLLSLLGQLNMDEMSEMGLELSADQIYSINHESIKDAVGALDGGMCTAELVSPDGLILTNHHCGDEEIQYHSSLEHDYLTNGFWAMSREEELPNEGKTISFLVRMEEVTDRVLESVDEDINEGARDAMIAGRIREIESEAVKGTIYEAEVKSMFEGNRYFLFVLITYLDVRLVGAPPESIGKFGSDTDNWVWPRHSGDFSMFRVYTGPEGDPAEYSPDNIPLKSKYFLPVSMKGYKKNDFAMVLGFPGDTYRQFTSYDIEELLNVEAPVRIKARGIRQELMTEDMMASEKVRIQYSSKYYESTNFWKYLIGQSKDLKKYDVEGRRHYDEQEFMEWVNADSTRQKAYGKALGLIKNAIRGKSEYMKASYYLNECIYFGMESVSAAINFMGLGAALNNPEPDPVELTYEVNQLRTTMADFYKDYDMPTDRKVMTAMIGIMLDDMPPEYQPSFIQEIDSKYKGNVEKYVEYFFKKSFITDEARLEEFLENPTRKALMKDPAFMAMISFLSKYYVVTGLAAEYDDQLAKGRRLYMKGKMEMYADQEFYPDANGTMRLTYGRVGDYNPRDAVQYDYFTTLKGVMEKEDPENPEFVVSDRLKFLYRSKDYGPYGEDGIMKVCFTTDNDITGGNSGSPVINGNGELIGIAFDGNWEAMSGDVAFVPVLQKSINVDIRYVLFVIDKYAGAGHLVDEMKLVWE